MSETLRIALPLGIGDAWWCATKLAGLCAISGASSVHAFIHRSPYHPNTDEYLKRFPLVSGVSYAENAPAGGDAGLRGGYRHRRWDTLQSCRGWNGYDCVLVPNGALERGMTLEEWLPEVVTDRTVRPALHERDHQAARLAGFSPGSVVLVPGGTFANRGWTRHRFAPKHWAEVVRRLNLAGVIPALVGSGADDELDYVRHIRTADRTAEFIDLYGRLSVGAALAAVSKASVVVGRASGITINAVVLGTPSVLLWPDDRYPIPGVPALLNLNHRMHTSWVPPDSRYQPVAYGNPETTPEFLAGCALEYAETRRVA